MAAIGQHNVAKDPKGFCLSLIAAVAKNSVVGAGGTMPWRLSSDLKRFKSITMGKPVIMGRKTYESIGKPLPGRTNIVVSRRGSFAPDGVTVVSTIDAAIARASKSTPSDDGEIMVIGGGEIYRAAMEQADRLYITHVEASPEGDVHFPKIDPAIWRATNKTSTPAGPKDSAATTFVVYERHSAPA